MRKSIVFCLIILVQLFIGTELISQTSILRFGCLTYENGIYKAEVIYENTSGNACAGFQFDIQNAILDTAIGGAQHTLNWSSFFNPTYTSTSGRVLAFAFGPPYISADSSALINLVLSNPNSNIEVCLSEIVVSDQFGNSISVISGPCLDIVQQNSHIANNDKTNIILFPNPVNDHLAIMSNGIDIKSISIWNLDGKLTLNNRFYNNEAIDISHLNKGLYIVQLRTDKKTFYENIIIS